MNRIETSCTGKLPAIVIASRDYPRLAALAESAAHSAPQVGEYLARELARASIVDDALLDAGAIRPGSTATYVESADDTPRTVKLVWPLDANVARDRISVISLVGAALLGMRAGQSIEWPDPLGGVRALHVLEVHHGPPRQAA